MCHDLRRINIFGLMVLTNVVLPYTKITLVSTIMDLFFFVGKNKDDDKPKEKLPGADDK